MTSARDVIVAVAEALVEGATGVARVAIPGDLPTQPGQYPIHKLRLVAETKQSTGRSSIGFTTIVTARLVIEVAEPVDADDDVNLSPVMDRLLTLKDEAERAIINSYPLFSVVQQLLSVSTQFAYEASGLRLGGIQSDYAFEIFQSADDFAPLIVDEITELRAVDPLHPPVSFRHP